jgi:hypothetical protein
MKKEMLRSIGILTLSLASLCALFYPTHLAPSLLLGRQSSHERNESNHWGSMELSPPLAAMVDISHIVHATLRSNSSGCGVWHPSSTPRTWYDNILYWWNPITLLKLTSLLLEQHKRSWLPYGVEWRKPGRSGTVVFQQSESLLYWSL